MDKKKNFRLYSFQVWGEEVDSAEVRELLDHMVTLDGDVGCDCEPRYE